MNIAVLSGSPKGELSVTLQYLRFAARKFPEHTFETLHVAQTIRKLEKDEQAFSDIIAAVQKADAVIWAFPLYFFLVASQYKRFIELVFEKNRQDAFAGKYAASVSTSIHFFDHTAHNYIHAICDDLAMNYLGAYSPAMYDLMQKKERDRWLEFVARFLDGVSRRAPYARAYPPLNGSDFVYQPGPAKSISNASGKKILILKDGQAPSGNIDAMVDALAARFSGNVDIVNLMDVNIQGGCLGCCRCGLNNECIYNGRDGYIGFYNEQVKKADTIVFAGALHDRYFSSRWKMYFDRSFFNTHIPTLIGKSIAFLVSGPLGQLPNLRQIMTAYGESQSAYLAGIVSDESANSAQIDALLEELAGALVRPVTEVYAPPITFLGVGGRKIFRDEVYGMLRFVFQADYRYYKKRGFFDFPQKNYKAKRMNALMMFLTKIPIVREKFLRILTEQMVKPLKHIAENR